MHNNSQLIKNHDKQDSIIAHSRHHEIIESENQIESPKNNMKAHSRHHEIIESEHQFESLKIPANWQEALDHGKARATSKEKEEEEGVKRHPKICKCCGYEVERDPIEWFKSNPVEDFDFLGAGYPLFYNFMIFCNILLGILMIGESIPDIVRYYQGDFCTLSAQQLNQKEQEMKGYINQVQESKPLCVYSFFNRASLSNILDNNSFYVYQVYYKAATYFLIMITLYYFRHMQRKINNHVDMNVQSPADYSIMIKNIPKNLKVDYTEELKKIIQLHKTEISIVVEKIVLVYEMEKLEEIEEEIDEKVLQKQEWLKNNLLDGKCQYKCKKVEEFDEEIEKLEHECEHIIKEVINTPEHYFAGAAIVSFSHESMKICLIEDNKISNMTRIQNHFRGGKSEKSRDNQLYWQDRHLYIEQAPEPNDIDWEFIHCSTNERLKARFVCNILQAIVMFVCFCSIWTLSFFQSKMMDAAKEADDQHEQGAANKYLLAQCVSGLISIILVSFNKFALPVIVHNIVDREKWSTKTKMNISFAIKLTLVLFCNTALMTLAVEILTFDDYYGTGGMIGTESMVFILNALIPPLVWLINPWYIQRKRERDTEEKLHLEQRSVLTQKQVNELHENTVYLSGKRYADIMKTMWFTFLYSSVLPLGSLFSSVGLFLYYWIDKYNIVNKFTPKENISIHLTMQMIDLLDLIIIIHAIGDLFFKYQLYGSVDQGDLWFLAASAAYNILMIFDIQLFDSGGGDEEKYYKDVNLEFDTDYDRENPYLKKKALEDFIKLRRKKSIKVDQNATMQSIDKNFERCNTQGEKGQKHNLNDSIREKSNLDKTIEKINSERNLNNSILENSPKNFKNPITSKEEHSPKSQR